MLRTDNRWLLAALAAVGIAACGGGKGAPPGGAGDGGVVGTEVADGTLLDVSHDQRQIAVTRADGTYVVGVVDAPRVAPVVASAQFLADDQSLLLNDSENPYWGNYRLWRPGLTAAVVLDANPASVTVNHDGSLLSLRTNNSDLSGEVSLFRPADCAGGACPPRFHAHQPASGPPWAMVSLAALAPVAAVLDGDVLSLVHGDSGAVVPVPLKARAVALSPSGARLATLSLDGATVTLYDVATFAPIWSWTRASGTLGLDSFYDEDVLQYSQMGASPGALSFFHCSQALGDCEQATKICGIHETSGRRWWSCLNDSFPLITGSYIVDGGMTFSGSNGVYSSNSVMNDTLTAVAVKLDLIGGRGVPPWSELDLLGPAMKPSFSNNGATNARIGGFDFVPGSQRALFELWDDSAMPPIAAIHTLVEGGTGAVMAQSLSRMVVRAGPSTLYTTVPDSAGAPHVLRTPLAP